MSTLTTNLHSDLIMVWFLWLGVNAFGNSQDVDAMNRCF